MAKIDTKTNEDDTKDTADLILNLVEQKLILRRKDIHNLLKTTDIGIATINRHIRKLLDNGIIKQIKYPEYKKYGIQNEDKKAVYFVSSSGTEQADYYDTIIEALNSEDAKIRKNAMIEIESIQEVQLLPEQLTNLSNALKTEDKTNCYQIIRVIWDHFEKLIFPSDIRQFENNLVYCFEKFSRTGNDAETYNLKNHILNMLGILNNSKVIEFFKKDLEEVSNLLSIQGQYSSFYLAEIIQKYKRELFEYGNRLPDDKNKFLINIRRISKNNLEKPEIQVRLKRFKEKIVKI